MSPEEGVPLLEQRLHPLSLDESHRAIALFSGTLTLTPYHMQESTVASMKSVGFSDEEVHAIVLVVACFSFMNRLADGTGVTLQADRYALAQTLFGPEALQAHLNWSKGE